LTEAGSELGDQISVISSEKQKKGGGLTHQLSDVSRFASAGWHADITFEPVPSDYAMLKIHTLPATGGDTVCIEISRCVDDLVILTSSLALGIRL
jgi:alpha-ketoglutarate-dependent taurine dioxygenase